VCLLRGTSRISIYSSGYLPQSPVLYPRPVCVKFVVGKVALREFFLPVLLFSPVSKIPPTPHTHLHLHVALVRRTNAGSLGIPKKLALWGVGGYCWEKLLPIFLKILMFGWLVFMTVRACNVWCHSPRWDVLYKAELGRQTHGTCWPEGTHLKSVWLLVLATSLCYADLWIHIEHVSV